MSLIDPSSRWWNRNAPRRTGAYIAWAVALVSSAVGPWSMWTSDTTATPGWVALACSMLSLPLLLLGCFLYAFSQDSNEFNSRALFIPLAAIFVAYGVGAVAGQHTLDGTWSAVGIIFILCGAIAIAATELIVRKVDSDEQLHNRVERLGVSTNGRVTRVRSYSLNHQAVTHVTVKFTDSTGQTRWASTTVEGTVGKGAMLRVKYSSPDLGRNAAVIVSRR